MSGFEPSASRGQARASSSTASRPSGIPGPSASRFGFRAPSSSTTSSAHNGHQAEVAATPLGKRTASSMGFSDHPPPSTAKKPLRAPLGSRPGGSSSTRDSVPSSPRPPSPSAAHQLSSLKSHYESRLLLSQQSYDQLEEEFRSMVGDLERLKSERRELLDEWERTKGERAAEKNEWQQEKVELQRQVSEAREEKTQLEEELEEYAETLSAERADHQRRATDLQALASRLEAEKAQAVEEASLARESAHHEAQLRASEEERVQQLEARIGELDSKKVSGEGESEVVKQELHRILTQSRQLEAELSTIRTSNTALKKQADSAAILREENGGLKKKLESLSELQQQMVEYEEREQRRKDQLEQWDSFLASSSLASGSEGMKLEAQVAIEVGDLESTLPTLPSAPAPISRSNLPAYLANLRGLASGLLTRCQISATKLEQNGSYLVSLERQIQSLSDEAQTAKREASAWVTKEEEWKRGKSEWQEETRRYRDLLKSYEEQELHLHRLRSESAAPIIKSEPAAVVPDVDQDMADPSARDEDVADTSIVQRASAQYRERISLLERELETKTAEIASLTEVHEAASLRIKEQTQSEREELESLRSDVLLLQRENARLDENLGRAEERLGFGEFNQEKYRCLVLKENPVDRDRDLRTATMNRLKGENEELIKRVEELSGNLAQAQAQAPERSSAIDSDAAQSSGFASGGSLVPASTVDNLRAEITTLTSSIATKDKALLRLKQVYAAKASEFRSAIQSLFGFKVRFLENGQVRLNSTFTRSSSRATSLIFKSDENDVGQMKLAGEAVDDIGLANIPNLRQYWLGSGMRQSVPCFLAALQLELYESTTHAVRGAWAVPDAEEEE